MSPKKKIPVKYQRMISNAFDDGMKHVQNILLKSLMKRNNWKQKELASFLNITDAAVSKILSEGRTSRSALEKMLQRIEDGITLKTLNSIYSPILRIGRNRTWVRSNHF